MLNPIVVLFVCSYNLCRSVTGELVFKQYHPDVWVRSCGTEAGAVVRLSPGLVDQAHLIVCMEPKHVFEVDQIVLNHGYYTDTVCLGIEDIYEPMNPELVVILRRQVTPLIDKLLRSRSSVGRAAAL